MMVPPALWYSSSSRLAQCFRDRFVAVDDSLVPKGLAAQPYSIGSFESGKY
jgi:hypothetical protein